MSRAAVLALDIGTTNVKVQRWDQRGRPVGSAIKARVPLEPDGTADADLLAESVELLIDEAMAHGEEPPAAVALTSAWHGLVGIDASRRPVTPFSSWLDTRAAGEARELAALVSDPAHVHQRTGAPLHPSFIPARLLWLSRYDPDSFASATRWCDLAEFMEVRWFGPEAAPSLSLASGSGLFNQLAGEWDEELRCLLRIPATALVEPLREPLTQTAPGPGRRELPLLPAYARRWPALAGVPWLPARGDGATAVLGSGCLASRRAALTVGTSAAVRVVLPWEQRAARTLSPALFAYLLDERRAVVGAARSNAGSLVGWARRVLWLGDDLRGEGFSEDPVERATIDRQPGAHRLRADSSLAGERSPLWPPEAHGILDGIRTDTTGWDILQALLEESVLGLADGVDALEEWIGPFEVVLSGGGARSEGWRHLLADALGRDIAVSKVDESSSRGAALAAMERFGWLAADALAPMDATTVRPDAERAAAFAALRSGRAARS